MPSNDYSINQPLGAALLECHPLHFVSALSTRLGPAKNRRSYVFSKHFKWGVATAAAQIEGTATADGKGESIWDRFANTRKIDVPMVACDHDSLYRDDVALSAIISAAVVQRQAVISKSSGGCFRRLWFRRSRGIAG